MGWTRSSDDTKFRLFFREKSWMGPHSTYVSKGITLYSVAVTMHYLLQDQ
jgi:hypothetical protein